MDSAYKKEAEMKLPLGNEKALSSLINKIISILNEASPDYNLIESILLELHLSCEDEQNMKVRLYHALIANITDDNVIMQVVQILFSLKQDVFTNAAEGLSKKIVYKNLNNIHVLKRLLVIAQAAGNQKIIRLVLKKLLKLDPNNLGYKIDFAKALVDLIGPLIEQSHHESKKYEIAITKIKEAKKLLLAVFEKEPENLTAITLLEIIVNLQGQNPKTSAYSNYRNTILQYKMPPPLTASLTLATTSDGENLKVLYKKLILALGEYWDPQKISEIIDLMLVEPMLRETDRSILKIIKDLLNSGKPKAQFTIRGLCQQLKLRRNK